MKQKPHDVTQTPPHLYVFQASIPANHRAPPAAPRSLCLSIVDDEGYLTSRPLGQDNGRRPGRQDNHLERDRKQLKNIYNILNNKM